MASALSASLLLVLGASVPESVQDASVQDASVQDAGAEQVSVVGARPGGMRKLPTARVLIAVGDARSAAGDVAGAIQAYRRALELWPELATDADFLRRFEAVYRSDGRATGAPGSKRAPAPPPADAPPADAARAPPSWRSPSWPRASLLLDEEVRAQRWLGVIVSFGPEAALGAGPTVFLWQHLQLSLIVSLLQPSVTFDVKGVLFKSRLSPYAALGVHLPFGSSFVKSDFLSMWNLGYIYAGFGAQYVSPSGFYAHFGLAFAPQAGSHPGHIGLPQIVPQLGLGWMSSAGR